MRGRRHSPQWLLDPQWDQEAYCLHHKLEAVLELDMVHQHNPGLGWPHPHGWGYGLCLGSQQGDTCLGHLADPEDFHSGDGLAQKTKRAGGGSPDGWAQTTVKDVIGLGSESAVGENAAEDVPVSVSSLPLHFAAVAASSSWSGTRAMIHISAGCD